MPLLEGDVVVCRRREVGALLLPRPGGHELIAAAVAVAPAAEELDALGDDLDGLALASVLGLPLAPVEPAVDRDRAALAQVLGAALGLVAEDRDPEEVRLVDPLPRLVPPPSVDGDAEVANGRAARRVPQLGVPRQVPDPYDAVAVCCHVYSSSSPGCSSASAYSGSASSETVVSGVAGTAVASPLSTVATTPGAAAASSRGALVREPAM